MFSMSYIILPHSSFSQGKLCGDCRNEADEKEKRKQVEENSSRYEA